MLKNRERCHIENEQKILEIDRKAQIYDVHRCDLR